jgi:hypothetical protein
LQTVVRGDNFVIEEDEWLEHELATKATPPAWQPAHQSLDGEWSLIPVTASTPVGWVHLPLADLALCCVVVIDVGVVSL